MIRRKASRQQSDQDLIAPKGFDAYDMRLGDVMRGERATLGKSLLDVQRELRIKAPYIAAIENCDPSVFDTPGFIAGYVRSYARYLDMDPDRAFSAFCAESGFSTAHGMSDEASTIKKAAPIGVTLGTEGDLLAGKNTPFAAPQDSFLSRIEPAAIGSALVLLMVIGGIGYGGYSVLNEVQRVHLAPVENTPNVLADLDPLKSATETRESLDVAGLTNGGDTFTPPAEALDRLYRPQALDVPVLVARDAPISTLDAGSLGAFGDKNQIVISEAASDTAPVVPQVVEGPVPPVELVAMREAWVSVTSANGTVIFAQLLKPGEKYTVPMTETPPKLLVGDAGALYFSVNGELFGPSGGNGAVVKKVTLAVDDLKNTYAAADLAAQQEITKLVAELQTAAQPQE